MIPNRLNGGMLFARWLAEKLKKIAANKINNLIVSRGLHRVYRKERGGESSTGYSHCRQTDRVIRRWSRERGYMLATSGKIPIHHQRRRESHVDEETVSGTANSPDDGPFQFPIKK